MNNCVMCDTKTNYSRVRLPYGYTGSMKNATDEKQYSPWVEATLCEDCKQISLRMVTEYETSPLPEWHLSKCEFVDGVQKTFDQYITDALLLVQSADERHVMDARADTAKLIVFEAARHGDIQQPTT